MKTDAPNKLNTLATMHSSRDGWAIINMIFKLAMSISIFTSSQ